MTTYYKGRSSALHNGVTWKRLMRIERAVQLQVAGIYKDSEIAMMIGVQPAHYSLIKQTPEFKRRMIAAASGVIAQNDLAVKTDIEYQSQFIKEQVPVALSRIANLMMSKNEGVALKAAAEMLDRDGIHAKVSKTSVEIKDNKDRTANDTMATTIYDILAGRATYQDQEEIAETMSEFTKGAMDADRQIEMTEEVVGAETLEEIDNSSKITVH